MKQNLTTIITRAREKNIVVILAGMEAPPNYGPEYVQSFRTAFRDVASKERVLLIPFLLDKVAGQASLNQPDGIHPNAEGRASSPTRCGPFSGRCWIRWAPLSDRAARRVTDRAERQRAC